MKYEFSFNPSRGYICIRTYGEASVRGFEKLMTETADSPNWKPGTNLLIDHRKLNSRNFSSDEMDEVKDLVAEKKEMRFSIKLKLTFLKALPFLSFRTKRSEDPESRRPHVKSGFPPARE